MDISSIIVVWLNCHTYMCMTRLAWYDKKTLLYLLILMYGHKSVTDLKTFNDGADLQ